MSAVCIRKSNVDLDVKSLALYKGALLRILETEIAESCIGSPLEKLSRVMITIEHTVYILI